MKSFTEIDGLSDIRRLPRAGKIHLGIRAKNQRGTEHPKEVDYFVVPPEVAAKYGPTPKTIPFMVPCEDRKVYFPTAYKCYGSAASLVCIGDGKTAMRDEKKIEKTDTIVEGGCREHGRVEVACGSPDKECAKPCAFGVAHGCRRTGLFRFLIPDVTMSGIYQIDTGSFNSIVDINSGIDFVRSHMAAITGQPRIAGVPLVLKRVPIETRYEGRKAVHYCLKVECVYTLDELRRFGQGIAASTQKVLIDAPTIEQEVEEDLIPASRQLEGGGQGVAAPVDGAEAAQGDAGDSGIEARIAAAIEILGWTAAKAKFLRPQYKTPELFHEFLTREVDRITEGGGRKEAAPEKDAANESKPPTKAEIETMRKSIVTMLMDLCGGDKEAAHGEFVKLAASCGIEVETSKDLKPAQVIVLCQLVKDMRDRESSLQGAAQGDLGLGN